MDTFSADVAVSEGAGADRSQYWDGGAEWRHWAGQRGAGSGECIRGATNWGGEDCRYEDGPGRIHLRRRNRKIAVHTWSGR